MHTVCGCGRGGSLAEHISFFSRQTGSSDLESVAAFQDIWSNEAPPAPGVGTHWSLLVSGLFLPESPDHPAAA